MKLVCLDFSNLIIRNAANPYDTTTDQADRPVGGAVGALAHGLRVIEQERPTHILVARDGSRSEGFRRQLSASYKAHRASIDEDLAHQFVVAYRGVEILGWPTIAEPGYEADDIIASAARSFPGQTLVISGDKDLLALCSEQITVRLLRPGGHRNCGVEECLDIFGVGPERVCDYKALVGDPSDGISGVPGIGPKRALALLAEHGDLKTLLVALERGDDPVAGVNSKITAVLRENIDKAQTSYQLAQLVEDLHIDNLEETLLCPVVPPDDEIGERLTEAGLHALRTRLSGGTKRPQPEVDIATAFERAVRQAQ